MPPSRTKATSRRARQWHLEGSKGGGEVWGGLGLGLGLGLAAVGGGGGGGGIGSAGGAVGVVREEDR